MMQILRNGLVRMKRNNTMCPNIKSYAAGPIQKCLIVAINISILESSYSFMCWTHPVFVVWHIFPSLLEAHVSVELATQHDGSATNNDIQVTM